MAVGIAARGSDQSTEGPLGDLMGRTVRRVRKEEEGVEEEEKEPCHRCFSRDVTLIS